MSASANTTLPREFRDDEQLVRVMAVLEAHVGFPAEDVRREDQSAMATLLAWLSACQLRQHSGVAPSYASLRTRLGEGRVGMLFDLLTAMRMSDTAIDIWIRRHSKP